MLWSIIKHLIEYLFINIQFVTYTFKLIQLSFTRVYNILIIK